MQSRKVKRGVALLKGVWTSKNFCAAHIYLCKQKFLDRTLVLCSNNIPNSRQGESLEMKNYQYILLDHDLNHVFKNINETHGKTCLKETSTAMQYDHV